MQKHEEPRGEFDISPQGEGQVSSIVILFMRQSRALVYPEGHLSSFINRS